MDIAEPEVRINKRKKKGKKTTKKNVRKQDLDQEKKTNFKRSSFFLL